MQREFIITREFDRTWKELGLDDGELQKLEIFLCQNPDAGDVMQGTGGVRKLRWSLQGRGKSGGASGKEGAKWQKVKCIAAL
ncbi:MAG: hypothetical protein HUK21_12930 [Fibrobacteraceae bacterium]|nr:hypothetical protein [Fibrobacteraceae bacterium]